LLIFLDESGFSECPAVRRTWAPRGKTPVLIVPFNWKRLSAIASVITTASARRVGLCLRLVRGTVKAPHLRGYLSALKRHVNGRQAILLWDRLPVHRSRAVQNCVRAQRSWLHTEYLPAYAPELNPVEGLWGIMDGSLANDSSDGLDQLSRKVRRSACRVRRNANLGRAFLKQTGLF
jgi:hypothetical protein